ncbi:MAG: hypothetical protein LQ343_001223 [Gyalolechia ehrenbergii]|nr:MAG: hypothetical protein LQ343_001223 [Gyalolechia ehrenbergii]
MDSSPTAGSSTVPSVSLQDYILTTDKAAWMDDIIPNGTGGTVGHKVNIKKVLIIGAGCTGLSLAHGLQKAGIPYVVYERDQQDAARRRDWNMGLHWAAPALQSLVPQSLFSRIQTTQVDPHTPTKDVEKLRFINGQTGEIIGLAEIEKFYRLRRSKIRALLLEGVNVEWGKPITGISYSEDGETVTASFADGSQETGSILVGADGPHSGTRSILVGAETAKCTPIDFAATMCFNKLPRDKALFLRSEPHHPLFQCAPNPSGTFAWLGLHDAPDSSDPESWVFFHYISFPEPREQISKNKSPADHIAHQKQLAKQYADPFKTAFEWLADDSTTAWYGKLQHWDPGDPDHHWDNKGGRVTLAGDAAHPMTFQRGQGLNHAVTDSSKLCKAIMDIWKVSQGPNAETKARCIQEYETEMIKRGSDEVRLGEMNTKMLHDWEKVMQSPVMQKGLKQAV